MFDGIKRTKYLMKKIIAILCVICAFAFGTEFNSFASTSTPHDCSTVSGASVTGSYKNSIEYKVTLSNNSGSRCSASFTVEAKTQDGNWEVIGDGILTADNGDSASHVYSINGYQKARVVNVSTWKCD